MENKMKNYSRILNAMIRDFQISDGAFRTLLVLKTFYYGDNKVFPSQQTLAKLRGKSRKTIINHLKVLKLQGLLAYEKRGYSASNQYHFIGEEKYTIDNKDVENNGTSKEKEISPLMLQKLQPNNTKPNNNEFNNNVENKDDWKLGRKRIAKIRKDLVFLNEAKKVDNVLKK